MRKLSAVLAIGLWLLATAPLASAYSGAAAANYANSWTDNDPNTNTRNPAWPSFGNDCANFVSQALLAGGYDMQNVGANKNAYVNWWATKSGSTWTTTLSWLSVSNLVNFLYKDIPGGSPIAYKGPAQAQQSNKQSGAATGDVIIYDWGVGEGNSHASIQVGYGIDPNSQWEGSLISMHTTDRKQAIWTLRPYNAFRDTTYFTLIKISTAN